jgi:hypothetical protein
MFSLAS